MGVMQQLPLNTLMLLLITVMPMASAQSLQLVYIGRSGNQLGNNRIFLECRRNSIAVPNPQIFVERSDLPRQSVGIVDNQNGRVTIVITQELEGLYSCSYSGDRSTNTLRLVAYPQVDLSLPSSYIFQEGLPATIYCQIMPGRLRQYYSVRWVKDNVTIATSTPHDVLPGYQLHDNFSLTINYIQLSDSSTSYRCSVTINDPRISGSVNIVYDQLASITVEVYAPPSIVIPPEPRVIAVVGDEQPNTTFICEAIKISACTTQISWIHNGRNTSESTDQRFQAIITGTSGRTVRSRLDATQLRGRDSGRIDCVASCRIDVPGQTEPLVLTTFRNTTLSVLTGDFETVVTVTTDGDMFIRINFQDGYRILDQTRLLLKYTDESSTNSRNMTSEEAYINTSRILLEVPRSRLPYERFRLDVALQVEGEVGPFVSDDKIHDITQTRTLIIVGTVAGGVVLIAVLSALVICYVCLVVVEKEKTKWNTQKKVSLKKLQLHINFIKKALPQLSDFETRQCFLDFLHEILQEGLKDKTIESEITQVVKKAVGDSHTTTV